MLPKFSLPRGLKSQPESIDRQYSSLEVAHILTIEIVEYSQSLSKIEQADRIRTLQEFVRSTPEFVRGEFARDMSCRITDGGMSLIFFREILGPIRCAAEIGFLMKKESRFHIRMGVHSGPVSVVTQSDGSLKISGEGVVTAQRVMHCGDADHVLLSETLVEMTSGSVPWSNCFFKLGALPLKSGRLADIYNFYTREVGNPNRPLKFQQFEQEGARRAKRSDWLRSVGGGFWNGTRALAIFAAFGTAGWIGIPKAQTYLASHPLSISFSPPFGQPEPTRKLKSDLNAKRNSNRKFRKQAYAKIFNAPRRVKSHSGQVNRIAPESQEINAPNSPAIELGKPMAETQNEAGANEKVYQYNMILSIPEDNQKSRVVKVTCLDSRGLQPTVLEANFSEGERIPMQFEGAGKEVTLRVYFNDKLAKEWRISASDRNSFVHQELR